MIQETVRYSGIKSCDINKQLELQKWILDPSSRPVTNANTRIQFFARSTGVTAESKSVVQKLLEVQQRILGNIE